MESQACDCATRSTCRRARHRETMRILAPGQRIYELPPPGTIQPRPCCSAHAQTARPSITNNTRQTSAQPRARMQVAHKCSTPAPTEYFGKTQLPSYRSVSLGVFFLYLDKKSKKTSGQGGSLFTTSSIHRISITPRHKIVGHEPKSWEFKIGIDRFSQNGASFFFVLFSSSFYVWHKNTSHWEEQIGRTCERGQQTSSIVSFLLSRLPGRTRTRTARRDETRSKRGRRKGPRLAF